MPRKTTVTMLTLAAVISFSLAALVFADGIRHPAAPAPPAHPAVASTIPAPPAVPAIHGVPALPPAPPAVAPRAPKAPRHPTIHADDMTARIVGETIVIESDGETWIVEDAETVRRLERTIDRHLGMAEKVARRMAEIQPALELAERIGRDVEASIEASGLNDLDLDLDLDLDMTLREVIGRTEEIARHAEAIAKEHEETMRGFEAEMKKFEAEMEQFEAEMEGFEEEMEKIQRDFEIDGDLDDDIAEILREALESGKAKRVE